jgi:hypothetical protein
LLPSKTLFARIHTVNASLGNWRELDGNGEINTEPDGEAI